MSAAPTTVVVQGAASAADVPGIERMDTAAELRYASTAAQLAAALPGAEVLFGWDFRSGDLRGVWPAADQLRWIHWPGAGVDAVLFPALTASDITLTNSRGVFDQAMAEYALGLIIAFAKGFPEMLALQAKAQWQYRMNERIAGKRTLVIGTGGIGRAVAALCRGAGMTVSGVGRRARSGDPDFDEIFGAGDLDSVLPEFDYVVLVAPLTDETRHMLGAGQFRCMKTTARLLNLGRGELIDEQALIAALQTGEIGGAALDVFSIEPLPADNPLWALPNVIVSPHLSGDFIGHQAVLVDLFVDNLRRYRSGEPLLNIVDKHRGYVPSIAR